MPSTNSSAAARKIPQPVVDLSRAWFNNSSKQVALAFGSAIRAVFILRKDVKKVHTTACVTRWQIRPVRSQLREGMPGVGHPRWQVELLKVKNGQPGKWTVEWK